MSLSPREAVRLVLEIAWRRRYLLIVPFLLMIPIAFAVQQLAPRSYMAKSLMLLMETSNNPLNKDSSSALSTTLRFRVEGLKALLISDRVLDNVMRDMLGPDTPSDIRSQDVWKNDFAERLTLDPVGTDFLEMRLKGSNPKGMGRQLEIVVSRFLDALLPGGASLSATELLMAKRKEELDAAVRNYQSFKARFEASADAGRQQLIRETLALKAARTQELEQTTAAIEQIRRSLGPDAPTAITLDTEVARLRETLEAGNVSDENRASLNQRLEQLTAMQSATAARAQLLSEIQRVSKSMDGLQMSQQSIAEAERQLQVLAKEVDEARALHDSYVARYGGQISTRASALTFAAPERIKLLGLPTDPTVPVGTLRTYLIFGFLGSIMLGIGLAILAEVLDPRVRRSQQIVDMTGLPVLARLP